MTLKERGRATAGRAAGGPGALAVLGSLLPVLFLFALFAAVGIVHVASRVLVMDAGYRLHALESDSRALTRENDRLKLELATLRSPSKLERIARERLGMSAPPATAVITVEAPRSLRLARAHPGDEGKSGQARRAARPPRPEGNL